jgi:alpha-tubulin suppressor-like RCC1 family protein
MKQIGPRILPLLSNTFPLMLFCLLSASPAAGQVLVWGDNLAGQTNAPASATNVIALAAGDYHCLALRADGTVVAWGGNEFAWGETNVPPDLTNVVSIAAGSTHSLALRRDGTVTLWGRIYTGVTNVSPDATNVAALALGPGAQHALVLRTDGSVVDWGNGGYDLTNIPPTVRQIVSVAAGSFFGLALRSDGTVVTWGNAPSVPANATNITAIAAGWHDAAALCADGTVLAWGSVSAPPQGSVGFTNVISLACPFNSTMSGSILALRRNGTLVEWPNAPGGPQMIPKNATNIVAVAAGSYDALALIGSGPPVFPGFAINRTVDSGKNAYFQMTAVGALPLFYQWTCNGTNIPGATNTILVVTNVQPNQAGHDYAVTASNAFGTNTSGAMRLYETPLEAYIQPQTVSTVVDGAVTFAASTIGQGPFGYQWQFDGTNIVDATNATLSLTNTQLADAGTYSVLVSNLFGVTTDFAGLTVSPTVTTREPQSQTIFPKGTVTLNLGLQAIIPVAYQWQFDGTNIEGATSNSLTLANVDYNQGGIYSVIFTDAYETVTNSAAISVVPVAAWGDMNQSSVPPGLTNLIAIASGDFHALALKADGTITGWGNNVFGDATAPPGLTNVVAIAAGNNDSLALRNDGTVVAWGNNSYGQTNMPPGLTNVVAVAAGSFHNLALKSDGIVISWGGNAHGETNVPLDLTDVVAVAADQYTSMALKSDGTVVTWGDNSYGESNAPANLTNVVEIASGGDHDLALKGDGTIVGWGDNSYGEDVPPTGLSNVVAIAAGFGHSAALKTDGTVAAWGYNYFGEANVPAGLTHVASISAMGFQTLALIGGGPPPLHVQVSNPQLSAGGFSLILPTQSGRVYRLEYKNSLSDSNWIALPLAAGNGKMLALTDSSATNGTARFYRVRQW